MTRNLRLARGSVPPALGDTWSTSSIRLQFPKLVAALGDRAFEQIAIRHFTDEATACRSARDTATRLAGFLATHPEYPVWYADLAALDHAHVDVFCAPATVPLARQDFSCERELRLVPGHALVDVTTSADALWRSLDDGEHAAQIRSPRGLDCPRTVLVWRSQGCVVRQRSVEADEAVALRAAAHGTMLDEIATRLDCGNPLARALDVILPWIDAGIVAS